MFALILTFLIQMFTITWTQFPDHIYLEKVGESFYSGEKYNILSPKIHNMRENAKAALRSSSSDDPIKPMFIDKNGFQRYWGTIKDGMRRTSDIIRAKIDNLDNSNSKNFEAMNQTLTVNNSSQIITKPTRKRPKRKKDQKEDEPESNKDDVLREGYENRTIAKISFFSPYFGVITMQSYVD